MPLLSQRVTVSSHLSCSSRSKTAQTLSSFSKEFFRRLLVFSKPSSLAKSIARREMVTGTPTPGRASISISAPVHAFLIAANYSGSVFFPSQNKMKRTFGSLFDFRRFILPVLRLRMSTGPQDCRHRVIGWHRSIPTLEVSKLKIVPLARANVRKRVNLGRSFEVLVRKPKLIASENA